MRLISYAGRIKINEITTEDYVSRQKKMELINFRTKKIKTPTFY